MADEATRKKYKQLIKNGFCIFDQVLDPTMLDRVRMVSDQLLNRQSQAHFREQKSTGSMVSVFDDVFFAVLVSVAKVEKEMIEKIKISKNLIIHLFYKKYC